jgi:hypothetical protein
VLVRGWALWSVCAVYDRMILFFNFKFRARSCIGDLVRESCFTEYLNLILFLSWVLPCHFHGKCLFLNEFLFRVFAIKVLKISFILNRDNRGRNPFISIFLKHI